MKPTTRNGILFITVPVLTGLWLVIYHDWNPWAGAMAAVGAFLCGRLYVIFFHQRLKRLWVGHREMGALKARIKELKEDRDKRLMEMGCELRRSRDESQMLAEELRAFSAHAQVRPGPNTRSTVRVQSSDRSGVTINGVHNPQAVWMATNDFDYGNTRLHQGSVITFDGDQYHGQDGVIEGITARDLQQSERLGTLRPIERFQDLPAEVVRASTEGAMAGISEAVRDFGFSMGDMTRRPSGVNQEAHSRINETLRDATRRVGNINERRRQREEDLKKPRRRTAWERLGDDDF